MPVCAVPSTVNVNVRSADEMWVMRSKPMCLKFSRPNVVGEISHANAEIGADSNVHLGSHIKKTGRDDVDWLQSNWIQIFLAVCHAVPKGIAVCVREAVFKV